MRPDLFSADVASFFPSPTRELFSKVDLNAIHSFAGGYPPAEAFPIQEIASASSRVLSTYGAAALQYGGTWGAPVLREAISRRYGVDIENIQITTSSQQGIDICARVMIDPGDGVLTTSPTYLGAIQSFRSYRADIVGVDYAEDADEYFASLDKAASAHNIKFIYIIPDFQNPTGQSLSLEHRRAIVRLACERDLIIVEDAPYRELRYEGEELPTIYSLCPERTLHLGSFSKICAPGCRLGWIFGPVEILRQINVCKQSLDLCPPMLDQYIIADLLERRVIDKTVAANRVLYRRRRDMMLSYLEKYMPEGCSWTLPQGGLFIFLYLPSCVDAIAMTPRALEAGVAYVAGSFFYPRYEEAPRNVIRLNYSFIAEERMEEGIRILASEIASVIEDHRE